jgi:hypothetical protein
VEQFELIVYRYEDSRFGKHMKVVFYSLLKTEGDILFEMSEYDLAIRCYKTLKDYCRSWGSMEYLKMKTYE